MKESFKHVDDLFRRNITHSKTQTSSYHMLCWNWFLVGRFFIDWFIFPVSLLFMMLITTLRNHAWLTLPVVVGISCKKLGFIFTLLQLFMRDANTQGKVQCAKSEQK